MINSLSCFSFLFPINKRKIKNDRKRSSIVEGLEGVKSVQTEAGMLMEPLFYSKLAAIIHLWDVAASFSVFVFTKPYSCINKILHFCLRFMSVRAKGHLLLKMSVFLSRVCDTIIGRLIAKSNSHHIYMMWKFVCSYVSNMVPKSLFSFLCTSTRCRLFVGLFFVSSLVHPRTLCIKENNRKVVLLLSLFWAKRWTAVISIWHI